MKDVVIDVIVLYVGLFGAVVYRWGDVYMAFLAVTGFMLTIFPLMLLLRRKVFIAWLSKYQLYPYNFIALALIPMVIGILLISSQIK
ncbi:MAG: hypothetical protein IJ914_07275 [Prevotella sp.]|nr:hypothetical protein [Prevotella sp.]